MGTVVWAAAPLVVVELLLVLLLLVLPLNHLEVLVVAGTALGSCTTASGSGTGQAGRVEWHVAAATMMGMVVV